MLVQDKQGAVLCETFQGFFEERKDLCPRDSLGELHEVWKNVNSIFHMWRPVVE